MTTTTTTTTKYNNNNPPKNQHPEREREKEKCSKSRNQATNGSRITKQQPKSILPRVFTRSCWKFFYLKKMDFCKMDFSTGSSSGLTLTPDLNNSNTCALPEWLPGCQVDVRNSNSAGKYKNVPSQARSLEKPHRHAAKPQKPRLPNKA